MSQDAWIQQVRAEVEQSPEYRTLYDMVVGWQMGHALFDERPGWFGPAVRQLAEMVDDAKIAYEAGRRYRAALDIWRYTPR